VTAGPLGGNARDEILFLGGGFVEVVSVGDFDFSDVRFLGASPTAAAAFADFDGDGDGDAMVGTGSGLERWDGDGTTTIAIGDSVSLSGVVDVATVDRGDGPSVVALLSGGTLQVVDGALALGDEASSGSSANRVFGGDVDGDGADDVLAVGDDGSAWVWITP
jgi:hypothetical protein